MLCGARQVGYDVDLVFQIPQSVCEPASEIAHPTPVRRILAGNDADAHGWIRS
jgi:hypothetical protein